MPLTTACWLDTAAARRGDDGWSLLCAARALADSGAVSCCLLPSSIPRACASGFDVDGSTAAPALLVGLGSCALAGAIEAELADCTPPPLPSVLAVSVTGWSCAARRSTGFVIPIASRLCRGRVPWSTPPPPPPPPPTVPAGDGMDGLERVASMTASLSCIVPCGFSISPTRGTLDLNSSTCFDGGLLE